jgi:hypothetical protein
MTKRSKVESLMRAALGERAVIAGIADDSNRGQLRSATSCAPSGSWGKPGPGKWVTVLNKEYEPEAHVILRFEPGVTPPSKRYWGTSGFIEDGEHGPGWIPESTFDAGYLSRFEERHPPGL